MKGRTVSGFSSKIEPIRVLDAPFDLSDFPVWGRYKECAAANPYKTGDVVWNKDGKRALVIAVFVERLNEADPISDKLPVLRVRPQTKTGEWSKLWETAWPGYIQRGYEKWKQEQEATEEGFRRIGEALG